MWGLIREWIVASSWPSMLSSFCQQSSLGYISGMLFEAHPVIWADQTATKAKGALELWSYRAWAWLPLQQRDMKRINHGFYQVKIQDLTGAPLLCRWSGKLNSSALKRWPKVIGVLQWTRQKQLSKSCSARLSTGYICLIMMVRNSYLSIQTQWMPTVHRGAGGRRGI